MHPVGKARVGHLLGRSLNLHLHVLLIRSRFLAFSLNESTTLVRLWLFLPWWHFDFREIFITTERVILLSLLCEFVLLLLLLGLLLLYLVLRYWFRLLHFLNVESISNISWGFRLLLEVVLVLSIAVRLLLRLSLFRSYLICRRLVLGMMDFQSSFALRDSSRLIHHNSIIIVLITFIRFTLVVVMVEHILVRLKRNAFSSNIWLLLLWLRMLNTSTNICLSFLQLRLIARSWLFLMLVIS